MTASRCRTVAATNSITAIPASTRAATAQNAEVRDIYIPDAEDPRLSLATSRSRSRKTPSLMSMPLAFGGTSQLGCNIMSAVGAELTSFATGAKSQSDVWTNLICSEMQRCPYKLRWQACNAAICLPLDHAESMIVT
jgi:hypothetical protein